MTVNKYTGKTKEEAIELAKAELGPSVVIMHVKEVKSGGFLGMFKSTSYEVTAGVEDDLIHTSHKATSTQPTSSKPNTTTNSHARFDMVADEKIDLNSPAFSSNIKPEPNNMEKKQAPAQDKIPEVKSLDDDFKDAFAEINKVLMKSDSDSNSSSNFIKKEEAVVVPQPAKVTKAPQASRKNNYKFVKMLYNTLLDNEVDERYINQISDDMGKVFANGSNIDYLISNVYQKMVLMMEEPNTIELANDGPKVVFFIGPTGVGKTTTIAKVASDFVLRKGKKVGLLTADTYRLGATDQLREYANILDIPMSIVLPPEDINNELAKYSDYDLVLVDTAGFSHKNQSQKDDMKKMLSLVDENYDTDTYLVLSATTKYKDLIDIIDTYKAFCDFNMIFTKLDETSCYGNILNCKLYSKCKLSYVTTGQNVPDDIEVLDTQKIVKQLLGGA